MARNIEIKNVRVRVAGQFAGDPAVSEPIEYEVEIEGNADPDQLRALVDHVDRIAEIPNSVRGGTPVRLRGARVVQVPPASSV